MSIWRLGARNLLRNRRRTLLSMGAVIAAVALLILGQGFIGGMDENIIRAQVDSLSGHVLVRPAGYPTQGLDHPVDELFVLSEEDAAWLDDNTVGWTRRVLFAPRVVRGPDALRARAFGYDPDSDPTVFPRETFRTTGTLPESGRRAIVATRGAARLLQIEVGDEVVLEARTSAGALNALSLPVDAIVYTGNAAVDGFGILVPFEVTRELLHSGEGNSHVAIRLDDRADAPELAATLRERLGPEVEVVTWVDETADMMAIQQIRRRALNVLILALLLISATGIANTVLMAAFERVREIGTLLAMGMTQRDVRRLFVAEGAMIGVAGAIVGGTVGASIVGTYSRVGIDLGPLIDGATSGNIPISAMLYLQWSVPIIALAMGFGVVVAVLSSLYPAVVASRMVPAEALSS